LGGKAEDASGGSRATSQTEVVGNTGIDLPRTTREQEQWDMFSLTGGRERPSTHEEGELKPWSSSGSGE